MILPAYTQEELAKLSTVEIINLIIKEADRVPRNVIDECARRGEEMTAHLRQLYDDNLLWLPEAEEGEWWLRLHAVMILGLIPGEDAGQLLVDLMRRMSVEEDENLQDWLAGYWAAFFENKPESVLASLRDLCVDQNLDWYIRANAFDPMLASALKRGDAAFDKELALIAKLAADETQEMSFRLLAASQLLEYPRTEYRPLLETLAASQSGWNTQFDLNDVQRAYAGELPTSQQLKFKNPWSFYEPEAILKRQKRWQEEDMQAKDPEQLEDESSSDYSNFNDFDFHETYIRPEAKTGRNDPCPCSSGKKYKKCCLTKE